MAQLLYGDRIGATAQLKVGCSAIIFDESRRKILLQRRTDNGRWSLPGGGMDAGESTEMAFVALSELDNYDTMEHHLPRVEDTLAGQAATFIR